MQSSMTGDQLKQRAQARFGWGYQKALAAYLNVDVSSIRRWIRGVTPVPKPVELAVEALEAD